MERCILHIDVNNAFLSWTAVSRLKNGEKLDIRTIPAIIGGDEASRHGIVLAKSPIAKQFGIKTGEPLYFARKKCPQIQIFSSNFKVYREYSKAMIEIFKEHTEKIEQFSIDECFLDLTDYLIPGEKLIDRAYKISKEIKEKLGFTVNIGVSCNKLLAKMASDFEKPDKVHTLYPDEIKTKMWPLPVSELLFVGKRSTPKLEKMGIKTIGDLANSNEKQLIRKFGKFGKMIYEYANGIDDSPVEPRCEKPKGIGNSITFSSDIMNLERLNKFLLTMTEQVTFKLRTQKMLASVVNVQIKNNEFKVYSHQRKLAQPIDSTKYIYNEAKELLKELFESTPNKQIRLLGIRVDNLCDRDEIQLSLFNIDNVKHEKEKQEKLDKTIDLLKNKYGYNSIKRAGDIEIKNNKIDK